MPSTLLRKLSKKRDRRRAIANIKRAGVWYVHIPKTSGASIRRELGAIHGYPFGQPLRREGKPPLNPAFNHAPARELQAALGEAAWDRLYTFAIVRNPWARVWSFYNFRKFKIHSMPEDWSFEYYVRKLATAKPGDPVVGRIHQHYSCVDYLSDANGKLIVDEVVKLEDRAAGMAQVGEKLGIPDFGGLHLNPSPTKTRSVSYRDVYTAETRALIAERYADDIETFGYVF